MYVKDSFKQAVQVPLVIENWKRSGNLRRKIEVNFYLKVR